MKGGVYVLDEVQARLDAVYTKVRKITPSCELEQDRETVRRTQFLKRTIYFFS